jgi:hypothetical protein
MDSNDRAFHDSMKPSWSLNGTLVFAPAGDISALATNSRRARERDGLLVVQKGGIVSEGRDVRFATFSIEVCICFTNACLCVNFQLVVYERLEEAKGHYCYYDA